MAEQVRSLAERLRERRAELGLSQAEAARELDVARTAYRLWEMEAAKPSPDRWRLIARWLGVSVSTMLVAEELLSEEEAHSAPSAVAEFDREGRPPTREDSDFYRRTDSTLALGVQQGQISRGDAHALGQLLRRIELQAPETETVEWEQAELRKALPIDGAAPSAARQAVQVTASGTPAAVLADATILVSELATSVVAAENDVAHGTAVLAITVPRDRIRVELAVRLAEGVAGLPITEMAVAFLTRMATRWGTGREDANTFVMWFEIDLPLPGGQREPQV
jgi:transcriptional regulator with XRE-family HTH domain